MFWMHDCSVLVLDTQSLRWSRRVSLESVVSFVRQSVVVLPVIEMSEVMSVSSVVVVVKNLV